jgi:amino acid permease
MNEFPGVGGGDKARFLAFFRFVYSPLVLTRAYTHLKAASSYSAFISAAFSYTGTETVILAAGEATNPTKQIPRAAKNVMYRIIVFYVLGVLIIGMM